MLASSHNNRHSSSSRHFQDSSSASTTSPSYTAQNRNFLNIAHSSTTPSPSELNIKVQHYFDANTSVSPDFQQSTQPRGYAYGLADAADLSMWQLGVDNSNGVANQMNGMSRGQSHQRLPSSSSIGSTMSATTSPYQGHQVPRNLRVPDQATSKQDLGRGYTRNMSNQGHLPSPTPTPTRNNFVSPTSSNFGAQEMNSALAASLGFNQIIDDETQQISHSNRPSFSSIGHGSVAPLTLGDDERRRMMQDGSMNNTMVTANNSLPDLFYSQNLATTQAQANPNFLMPHGGSVNERLMEAQMARSQSSGSNQSAPRSPMRYHMSPHTDSEPKTISPKDAVLDYNPSTDDFPLFGQTSDAMNGSFAAIASPQRAQYNQPNISVDTQGTSQGWTPSLSAMNPSTLPSYNTFATPSLPTSMGMGNINGYNGTSGNPRRTIVRQQTDQTPVFPAQLTSMESSASEAAPPSSGASSNMIMNIPKPDSSADTGTYSCTYHGCLQRFTTPQKLQKHKRDVHRNTPHVTPGVGSGMSTAELMERNSQSGPHKCDRLNPTTGKTCNAIFSRPYDLTRHEDTIHNARKQKVRCAICTEEKMFSRSDALTRHMRVVHPEVDFPGKHRKRGSRGE